MTVCCSSSPWSSWPRTPLARAHDARPSPCRPCLARRPAHSSPEPSPCYLSRPRLSLSLSRERRLPWPPLASPLAGLPRSSLLHPSSRPNDPVASFFGLHRCSPTRLPPSRAAGPPPPRSRPPLSAPSPWSHHCRPPSRAPRPSKGSPRSPLAFPQRGPHRRCLSSLDFGAPSLLCSPTGQGLTLRRK